MKKRPDYRALVADYERGTGLTQREFCGRHGVAPGSFSRWLRKLRAERGGGTAFVPLNIVVAPPPGGVVAEIAYPCGVVVRLSGASAAFILGLVPPQRP
jgi:transposase-like protein